MAKYFHEGRGWEKLRVQMKMQRINMSANDAMPSTKTIENRKKL